MRFRHSNQDEQAIEHLLGGGFASSEVPPALSGVAAVLASAAAPARGAEVSAAGVAGSKLASVAAASRRGPRLLLVSRSRIAVVSFAAGFILTGSLAAAGALPSPVQGVAHNVLDKIGIHIPGPDVHAGSHPFERGKSGKTKENIPGPPATPPGRSGNPGNGNPSPGPGNGNGKGQTNAPEVPKAH